MMYISNALKPVMWMTYSCLQKKIHNPVLIRNYWPTKFQNICITK